MLGTAGRAVRAHSVDRCRPAVSGAVRPGQGHPVRTTGRVPSPGADPRPAARSRDARTAGMAHRGSLVVVLALTAPRELSDGDSPPGTWQLTIMVANVLGGGADAGAVATVIQERKPDLVSLPEAQVDIREEINAHLKGLVYNGYTQQD